jgi:predicted nucleotidyltransferase
MRPKINEMYRKAAEEFARRVVAALGDQVDSIVLYGSVARKQARRYSDIDILIVSPNPKVIRNPVSQIRADFNREHNFDFLISLVHYNRDEFRKFGELGFPFVKEVLRDGVILYGVQASIEEAQVGGIVQKAEAFVQEVESLLAQRESG